VCGAGERPQRNVTAVSGVEGFPNGFFTRADETSDSVFYDPVRLVTHIDERAIAAVGALYRELGIDGDVLDLMSSWVSHFEDRPRNLTVLGMNGAELDRNPMASARVVHDLNADPTLPFADASCDAAVCCVSVDYLVRPVEVFRDVGRVLRPGGVFACTFSNRLFPTKAIRGWLATDDAGHVAIVERYFARCGAFAPATARLCTPPGPGDPLYGVWATASGAGA
jgi:SAM-dependent methyltransferase